MRNALLLLRYAVRDIGVSTHAIFGHAGISGAWIVVVAFAENDLVEVFALVVESAGIGRALVGNEAVRDGHWTGEQFQSFDVDAIPAILL